MNDALKLYQDDAKQMLLECADRLEDVFRMGHQGFTTINHYGSDIFFLISFVKSGNWQFKEPQ